MFKKLLVRGLVPAGVTAVLAAAAILPVAGAVVFMSSAYTSCSSVTLTATPPSPQMAGTQVTFTATAASCTSPVYEFWMRAASQSSWQLLRGYSSSNQYVWNSTGAAPGVVNFGVWAKDSRNSPANGYEANTSIPYTINPSPVGSPCTAAGISAAPTSVIQGSATHVIITGTGVCPNPNPRFEFWARWSGTPNWVLLQGYSTTNTYNWDSNGANPGIENFGVWVQDASSNRSYDAVVSTQVTVVAAVCSSAAVTAAPPTVVHSNTSGTHIIATATATCNGAGPFFAFWLRPTTSAKWIALRGYTTAATYDWNTTGAPVGDYYIGVWAKDGHSSNAQDSVATFLVHVI
jgi:hypothetical protein